MYLLPTISWRLVRYSRSVRDVCGSGERVVHVLLPAYRKPLWMTTAPPTQALGRGKPSFTLHGMLYSIDCFLHLAQDMLHRALLVNSSE